MIRLEYVVEDEYDKARLDVFLEKKHGEFSRSHYKKQIESGQVTVNDKQVKAGYSLKAGDNVLLNIEPPKEVDLTPQNIPLDVVYQDKDMVVINKPQGLVVHPSVGNWDGTLVNALLYQIKDLSGINGEIRPGIVHRLDKDTSGLLVIAKHDNAHVNLSKQIQDKTCKRFYQAIVEGNFKQPEGTIITNISRDKRNRLKMAVAKNEEGKYAETHYKTIQSFKGCSLVEFELKTGRTHQIRVHSAHLGHPIVGDVLYNGNKPKFKLLGQLLHAYKLVLTQPTTGEVLEFTVPLPQYFNDVLQKLETE